MTFIDILRKVGLFVKPQRWEIEAAEDENSVRNQVQHSEAVRKYEASSAVGIETSHRLRATIKRARTSAFSDLEQSIGGRHHG